MSGDGHPLEGMKPYEIQGRGHCTPPPSEPSDTQESE